MDAKAPKEFRIGKQVLKEQDLLFTYQYDGELFTMRYPSPLTISLIENEIARRLGGIPRESYSLEHVSMVSCRVYIDYLVEKDKSPSWFNVWECLDDNLVVGLYETYVKFRDTFRERIRTGYFTGNRK